MIITKESCRSKPFIFNLLGLELKYSFLLHYHVAYSEHAWNMSSAKMKNNDWFLQQIEKQHFISLRAWFVHCVLYITVACGNPRVFITLFNAENWQHISLRRNLLNLFVTDFYERTSAILFFVMKHSLVLHWRCLYQSLWTSPTRNTFLFSRITNNTIRQFTMFD